MYFTLTSRVINVDFISILAYIAVQEKTSFKIAIVNVNVESCWAIIVNALTKNSS